MSTQGEWVPYTVQFERRQVQLWIQVEGKMISLQRPSPRQQTAAGGYASTAAVQTLPPKMRIVATQARENFLQSGDTTVGLKLKQYILGPYGDDIQQGDYFVDPDSGKTYTVEALHPDQTKEVRGELTELPG